MPRAKNPIPAQTTGAIAPVAEKPKRVRKPKQSDPGVQPVPIPEVKTAVPTRKAVSKPPAQTIEIAPPPALPLKAKKVRQKQPQKGQSQWHQFAKNSYAEAKKKTPTLLYKDFLKAGEVQKLWTAKKLKPSA